MHRLVTAAVALALAAPASARSPYRPCAHAASVVARDLVPGAGPPDLAGRPLYELELTVLHHGGFRVTGREQVSYAASSRSRVAILILPAPSRPGGHAPLTVTKVAAVVGAGPPREAPFARGRGRITVTLPRAPRVGERVALRLKLSGRIPVISGGLLGAVQGYLQPGALGGTLVADARAASVLSPEVLLAPRRHGAPWVVPPAAFGAPGPAPVACHLVTVEAPADLEALPSGTTVGTVPVKGGRVRHVFVAAGRRVGLILAPRGQPRVTRHAGKVTVTAVAGSAGTATTLARDAAAAVTILGRRLGPLPWNHLTVAVGPVADPLGGSRVGGLVVVSPYLDQAQGVLAGFGGFGGGAMPPGPELVVTRQVARQWFGEVVATPGPAAPVVESLLAGEAALEVIGDRHGRDAVAATRRIALAGAYTVYRSLGGVDGPADRPATALKQASTWAGLCGAKAPALFGPLAARLGEPAVAQAVDGLARDHRFGVVDRAAFTGRLVAAAPKQAGRIHALLVHWLDQAHGDQDLGGPDGALGALFRGFPGMLGARGGQGLGNLPDPAALQKMMQQMARQMLKQLQGGGP